MDWETLYSLALQIATRAHAGQRDKGGHDYIGHPLRVAERCATPQAKIVALLHDTLEDTPLTAQYLTQQGFPDLIVEALQSLTRNRDEDYDDYISRAASNPIGRQVKLADLEDNMDLRRLPSITDRDVERLRKYLRAWHRLNSLPPDGNHCRPKPV